LGWLGTFPGGVGRAVAGTGPEESALTTPHVALPYACNVDRGRLLLTPSGERLYRIVGPRDSYAHTACAPGQANRCRTWQIHKFDLLCNGTRVAWLGLVGAALERTPGRARIENNRLHLRLGLAWRQPRVDGRDAIGPPPSLIFPAGFAPSLGLGMRFVGGAQPQPTVVDLPRPRPEARPARPQTEPAVATAFTPGPAESPLVAVSAVAAWQTAIAPAVEWSGLTVERTAVLAVGVVLALLALHLLRRRWGIAVPLASLSGPHTPDEGLKAAEARMSEAAECSELISRAVNLHRATRDTLAAVTPAELRELLADDLTKVQEVLLSARLSDAVAAGAWASVREIVTPALADLERIGRIVAGTVKQGLAGGRLAAEMPGTAEEAFEVLGVNPQASQPVVKKIVDGLRQSWHPDHARDEDDRQRREERMKQINIAWELIQRRGAAKPDHQAA
jgi:hypothetical protein